MRRSIASGTISARFTTASRTASQALMFTTGVSTFLETLHRDFEKTDYAKNALIVTHGFTLRLFLMRWFHWSVEEFQNLAGPSNGEVFVMLQGPNNRYALTSELSRIR
jgi:broad specificity phosphatase PhoE